MRNSNTIHSHSRCCLWLQHVMIHWFHSKALRGNRLLWPCLFGPLSWLSLVWGGQCEWRASSKHPRCFQSLCVQLLGQYQFPPPTGKRMGSSGHETEIWMLWSLNATIQYYWKSSNKYYDVLWWYVHEYICIYTHYDWLQVGILFKKLFDTMGCKINHLSWWMR